MGHRFEGMKPCRVNVKMGHRFEGMKPCRVNVKMGPRFEARERFETGTRLA